MINGQLRVVYLQLMRIQRKSVSVAAASINKSSLLHIPGSFLQPLAHNNKLKTVFYELMKDYVVGSYYHELYCHLQAELLSIVLSRSTTKAECDLSNLLFLCMCVCVCVQNKIRGPPLPPEWHRYQEFLNFNHIFGITSKFMLE